MNIRQGDKSEIDPRDTFRVYRHDLLNGFQLIQAYIQMNRDEQALRTLHTIIDWQRTLSVVQNAGDVVGHDLLWVAARCPHVLLRNILGETLPSHHQAELQSLWLWMEEKAAEHGLPYLWVDIKAGLDSSPELVIEYTEETWSWWNSVQFGEKPVTSWKVSVA